MRAFFDDMLASIFVLAVLAASYIFLFMGTVQSGAMMTNALQHRIKIEQLQSASQAFRYLTEPNTGENLAYLVGLSASTGQSKLWVGNYPIDTIAATEGALKNMMGSNYQLSVELPSKQIDLVFLVAQSPTMVEEKNKLIEIMPELRQELQKKQINATTFLYFLSYNSCSYEWCDNSTQEIITCSQMYFPPSRGEANYNIATALNQISQVPTVGLKVVIPLTDSLLTGDAPDSCYSTCNTNSLCYWCSTDCSIVRSDFSLRGAILQAQMSKVPICPIAFPKCTSLDQEAQDHFNCLGISNMGGTCSNCDGCEQYFTSFCFDSCQSQLENQLQTLGQATGCQSELIQTSEILDTILVHIDKAIAENKFKVGMDPPKDTTVYSEDLVLPITPPLNARLSIW
jgi:hypothetical protein